MRPERAAQPPKLKAGGTPGRVNMADEIKESDVKEEKEQGKRDFKFIRWDASGVVGHLTMNRPKQNIMNIEMLKQMAKAVEPEPARGRAPDPDRLVPGMRRLLFHGCRRRGLHSPDGFPDDGRFSRRLSRYERRLKARPGRGEWRGFGS